MTERDRQFWAARMRTCLERLSSAPSDQVAYLQGLGVEDLADELALEFDDVLRPLAPLIEEMPSAAEVLTILRRIDVALSAQNLPWSSERLSSPGWDEIRGLASAALEANWEAMG